MFWAYAEIIRENSHLAFLSPSIESTIAHLFRLTIHQKPQLLLIEFSDAQKAFEKTVD